MNKKRLITCTAIALLLSSTLFASIAFNRHMVSAHSGIVLTAWTSRPPKVDGFIDKMEWASADTASFRTTGGVEGGILVMNDASNLYIAVITADPTLGENQEFIDIVWLYFDNDNDGLGPEKGDDIIGWNGYMHEHFRDGYSPGTYEWLRDIDDKGTSDGAAEAQNIDKTYNSFEIAHPLNSRDDYHDFSLRLGDVVGFALRLTVDGKDRGWWPSSDLSVWHDIKIASALKGRILIDEAHNNRGTLPGGEWSEAETYLEANGYIVDYHTTGPITSTVLDPYDVLLIAAPFTQYNSSEISAIHSFVSSGHGAFLLGEWHSYWPQASYLNAISSTYGITFESNTVYDPTNYQVNTYWPIIHILDPAHPVSSGVSSFQIFAGCSLSLSGKAVGLAWGDDDTYTQPSSLVQGVPTASGGGLLSTEVQPTQPIDPIVMLAAAYYRAGRVVAFSEPNAFDDVDHDNDGSLDLYDFDNEVLLLKIIDWLVKPPPKARILIDEAHNNRGGSPAGDWTGAEAFLEAYGHIVDYHLTGLITPTVLSGYDILLIAAPFTSYSSSEISAIHSFVSSGHGAFLLGEWHSYWPQASYLNAISSTYGITFESNTVYDPTNYQVNTIWPIIHVLDPVHPVSSDISSFQIFAGCSLSLSGKAVGLAWGDDDTYTQPSSLVQGVPTASGGGLLSTEVQPTQPIDPIVMLAASYYGSGRVVAFSEPNAFDGDDGDGDGSLDLYDFDNEWLLLMIVNWLIVPLNNLSVDKVVPVQVLWENKVPSGEAEALIKDKKTALYVVVSSTFSSRVWAEIEITYNFGQVFLEFGPYGSGVPIEPGVNEFYLPGGPRQNPWYSAWVGADQPPWLYWTSTGIDNNIKAKVDPFNKISELNELDNTGVTSKKVVDSSDFRVLYVPVYFPDWGESAFTPDANWIQRSNEILVATYPIAEADFTHFVTSPWAASSPVASRDWLYDNVANPWSLLGALFGWDRVVIICQNLGPFCGCGGVAIGILRTPENRIPVCVEHLVDDHVVAHEIGHTMYLWHPHDIGTPVYDAQRFSVAKRDFEDWVNTFMSYRTPPMWIDKHRYDTDPKTWIDLSAYGYTGTWQWNLYDQFRLGPDPEVIIIHAYMDRQGVLTAPDPWYHLPQGTPDLEPGSQGNYYIVLRDAFGRPLAQMGFNILFSYLFHGDPGGFELTETELVHFAFTVPYFKGTALIQIQDSEGKVLYARTISANSPEVTVTYPNGGEILKLGETHRLTWQAHDLDGDKLSYGVSYSNDGGETWVPVVITLTQPEFLWDTTGLPPGKYLIKIEASDGFNVGRDISDRIFTLTHIAGDIDGDGDVDYRDLFLLARSYGSAEGEPAYLPMADIDSNGKVDYKDLFILARNYGKEDP